ncbi:MAG: UpxY family transcription antiterminator [Nitrospiraceae bacterium]|nr:UpxY family transcription antiterminator [Nitrospiraceae bacterium]
MPIALFDVMETLMESIGCKWYAIYVRSRHEGVAYGQLQKKGVESYLPLIKRNRQWKDRKKMVEFPLFPGYLFVRVNPCPSDFVNVLKARGVVSLVSGEQGVPVPVPDGEIDSLKLMMGKGDDLDIYPALREGVRVMVRRGPLNGAAGVIIKKEDGYMLIVNIEILGRSIGVKVSAEDIEAV